MKKLEGIFVVIKNRLNWIVFFFVTFLSAGCKSGESKVERLESMPFNTQLEGYFVNVRKFSSGGQSFFVFRVNARNSADQEIVAKAPFSEILEQKKIERMDRAVRKYFTEFDFNKPTASYFQGLDNSGFWLEIVRVNSSLFVVANRI